MACAGVVVRIFNGISVYAYFDLLLLHFVESNGLRCKILYCLDIGTFVQSAYNPLPKHVMHTHIFLQQRVLV